MSFSKYLKINGKNWFTYPPTSIQKEERYDLITLLPFRHFGTEVIIFRWRNVHVCKKNKSEESFCAAIHVNRFSRMLHMPYHIDRNMLVTPITVTKQRSIPFYTQVGAGIISYNFLKFRRYFDDFFFYMYASQY